MNRRTFISSAAGLVTLAACKREPQFARVDAALAPLIPSSTLALAGLRLDRLRDTPFYRRYVEGKQISMLEEIQAQTGLDPRKDIWEIVLAYRGQQKAPLAFIRGKFGGEFGREPNFDRTKFRTLSHKGYYILTPGEGAGVLFMNTGAAVAGKIEDLMQVIDVRDDSKEQPPEGLLELVKTLPGSAHFWMAAEQGAALLPAMPSEGNFANLGRMAQATREVTMFADLKDGMRARLKAVYADPQSAKMALDFVKGMIGLARLKTPDGEADLLKLFDGVRPLLKETALEIEFVQPFELMDRVISLAAGLRRPDSSTPRPR
ncbi:MAG: hypothetical protein IH602_15250 [Bryobacteraceae bacterium]|nr:hypothetical protein [Bryobacteraceae bacterium]